MRILAYLLVALYWLQPILAQDAEAAAAEEPKSEEQVLLSVEDLLKLPGKQLRSMLDKKGVVCKGCSEKIDFVNRVFETQGLPDVEPPKPIVEEGKGLDKEKIDELLDDLRRRGFTDKEGNIVSGSDFANMSPEEMIAAMNRGKPPPKSPKKSKKSKKLVDEFDSAATPEDKKAAAEDKAAKEKAAKEKAAKDKAAKSAKAKKAAEEKQKKSKKSSSSSSSDSGSRSSSSSSKVEKSDETIEL